VRGFGGMWARDGVLDVGEAGERGVARCEGVEGVEFGVEADGESAGLRDESLGFEEEEDGDGLTSSSFSGCGCRVEFAEIDLLHSMSTSQQ
jgi:hypothetical protein